MAGFRSVLHAALPPRLHPPPRPPRLAARGPRQYLRAAAHRGPHRRQRHARRSQAAQACARGAAPSRAGIIAYGWQPSDDGTFALVEFVAVERAAFAPILADKSLKVFEKGKARREEVEAEFRKHKKDFRFETLRVVAP